MAMVRALILTLAFVLTCPLALCAQKLRVPSDDALKGPLNLIKEVYGEEHANAKTNEQLQVLAKKLFSGASKTDDPIERFALLRVAQDIAAQGCDGQTAFQIIDEMDTTYQVDAVAMKASVLHSLTKKARLPADHKSIAERALALVDLALARDDFETSGKLAEMALSEARKLRDADYVKSVDARSKEIEALGRAFLEMKAKAARLEEAPTDPEANLAVGRYLCLVKGDWENGLPMLALGSDAALKAVAARDLKGAESAEEQAARGDAWWALAATREGPEKEALMLRAGSWYRAAQVGVSGLVKVKIAKRLEEIDVERIAELQGVGHRLVFKFDDEAYAGRYWHWSGEWSMAGDGGKAPRGPKSFLRTRHAYGGNLSIDMDFSFGQAKFSNTGGCWVTLWGKQLVISNAWRGLRVQVHIHRDGDEIVMVHNGQEKRMPVESSVWLKPTVVEVRWRSRTSHFRRIEIKAQTMVAVK
jgi:hypothetical protein